MQPVAHSEKQTPWAVCFVSDLPVAQTLLGAPSYAVIARCGEPNYLSFYDIQPVLGSTPLTFVYKLPS